MKRTHVRIALACLLIGGAAHAIAAEERKAKPVPEQPAADTDALAAIKAGKIKFKGLGGASPSVPGIDTPNCLVDRKLVDTMPDTGDVPAGQDPTPRRLAAHYAFRYNSFIRKQFVMGPPMTCASK